MSVPFGMRKFHQSTDYSLKMRVALGPNWFSVVFPDILPHSLGAKAGPANH